MKLYDNNGWVNSQWSGTKQVDALNAVNDHSTDRTVSRVGAGTNATNDYNVVGLNVNKIENMRTVITDYVTGIQKYLDDFNPSAISAQAFRGEEVNEAVKNYIDSVKKYCMDSTSYLLAFCDKLTAVREAYQANMAMLGKQIDGSKSSLSNSSAYVADKQ